MPEEQRKTERSKVFLIAEFSPLHKRSATAIGITNSFSTAGISIEAQTHDIRLGEMLEISLKHPQMDKKVTVRGKVVWKRIGWYKYAFGVEFTDSDPETSNMLLELEERLKHISPDMPLYNDKTIDSIQDVHPSSAAGKDIEEALRAAEEKLEGPADGVSVPALNGAEDKPDDHEKREPGSRDGAVTSDVTGQTQPVSPETDTPPVSEPASARPKRTVSQRIRRRSPALAVTAVLVLSIAILFALPDEITHLNGILDRLSTMQAPDETAKGDEAAAGHEQSLGDMPLPEDNPPVAPESAVPFELPEPPMDISKGLKMDNAVRDTDIIHMGDTGPSEPASDRGTKKPTQESGPKAALPIESKPSQSRTVEKAVPERREPDGTDSDKTTVTIPKPDKDNGETDMEKVITKSDKDRKTIASKPVRKAVKQAEIKSAADSAASSASRIVKAEKPGQQPVKRRRRKPLPPKKKIVPKPAADEVDEKIVTASEEKDSGDRLETSAIAPTDKIRTVETLEAVKKQPATEKAKPAKVAIKEKPAPGVAILSGQSEEVASGRDDNSKIVSEGRKPEVAEPFKAENPPKSSEKAESAPVVAHKKRPMPKIALIVRRRPAASAEESDRKWTKIGTVRDGYALFYDMASMKRPSVTVYEVSLRTIKDGKSYIDRVRIDCLNRRLMRTDDDAKADPRLSTGSEGSRSVENNAATNMILYRLCSSNR
jgi:hypothetical protein